MARKRQFKLDVLPEAQRKLWPELAATPKQFVLYGGTAIALQRGHRYSVDFDFFSNEAFEPDALLKNIPYLKDASVLDRSKNTLTCSIKLGESVKVSFFGGLDLDRVKDPLVAIDNRIKVASLEDLAGMKCAVVMKRAEWKDYIDIGELLGSGISLERALAAGKAIYGKQFTPATALKALAYHKDIKINHLSSGLQNQFKASIKTIEKALKGLNLSMIDSLNHALKPKPGFFPTGPKLKL